MWTIPRHRSQFKLYANWSHYKRTLSPIGHPKVCQAKLLHVLLEGHTLRAGIGLSDKRADGAEVFAGSGGYVVIYGRKSAVRTANWTFCSSAETIMSALNERARA